MTIRPAITENRMPELQAELARILHKQSLITLPGGLAAAFLAVYLLKNGMEHNMLFLYRWLICSFVLTTIRLLFTRTFDDPAPRLSPAAWVRGFVVLSACSGLLWGYLAFRIIQTTSLYHSMLIIFLASGLSAAAMSSYIVSLRVLSSFICPFLISIILAAFLHGDGPHFSIAILTFLYMVVLFITAKSLNRSIVNAVQQQFEKKNLIARLEQAKQEAEDASAAKSTFLATISHELRTPLNSIMMAADKLTQLQLPSVTGPYITIIRSSSEDLLTQIDDIIDHINLIRGRFQLRETNSSIIQLLEKLNRIYDDFAKKKGLSFSLRIDPAFPDTIFIDRRRLQQILVNLLDNAIKFTEQGTITLSAGKIKSDSGSGEIFFRIADTGIGINHDKMNDLFEPFVQGDSSTTRQFQGMGLGLSIARQLANAIKGRLSVESTPDQGSIFTLCVPLHCKQTTAPTKKAAAAHQDENRCVSPLSIVLAEDDAMNRLLLAEVLTEAGHTVQTVDNGFMAMLYARFNTHDILITDLHMPHMDGLQLIKKIRHYEKDTGGYLPIIAVTALTSPVDRDECLQAGADGYVNKPIDQEKILQVLQDCFPLKKNTPNHSDPAVIAALDYLLRKCKGKMGMFNNLLGIFIETVPDTLRQMEEAIDRSDSEQLWRNAHKLKGQLTLLDLQPLIQQSLQLEIMGRDKEMTNAGPLFVILCHETKAFLSFLRNILTAS